MSLLSQVSGVTDTTRVIVYSAESISFTPTNSITSTNTQDAIEEVDGKLSSSGDSFLVAQIFS